MKCFIFILFFIFFKSNAGEIYKTLFIPELIGILTISDSSINLYYYTIFRQNTVLKIDFGIEEQKISSAYEGDMISICYIWNESYKEILVIVKSYLYVMSNDFRNYIKFDYLIDKYSILVLDEFFKENGTTSFCSFFITFINSENKLEIYNYKIQIDTINYSLLKSKEIDLINSSGKISLNNCEYTSCHKAKK